MSGYYVYPWRSQRQFDPETARGGTRGGPISPERADELRASWRESAHAWALTASGDQLVAWSVAFSADVPPVALSAAPSIWGFLAGFGIALPFGFIAGVAFLRAKQEDEQAARIARFAETSYGQTLDAGHGHTLPPITSENFPGGVICACDCDCKRPLQDGNVMAEEVEAAERAWDGALMKPGVDLLICVECYVGNHRTAQADS